MMLTTKTLGRDAGCVVMSLGAVMFDPSGKDAQAPYRPDHQLYAPISGFDSANHNLKSDMDTLRWWKKQSAWPAISEEFTDSNISVEAACMMFDRFIAEQKPEKIWCNSPRFHVPILSALFSKAGMALPFGYRSQMDCRTALELAYGTREMRPAVSLRHGFYRHHALGDAISQAESVIRALRDIRESPSPLLDQQRWMMVDIETLGMKPGDSIISIGASVFNASNDLKIIGNVDSHFYRVLSLFDLNNHGFQSDDVTLKWWKEKAIWKSLLAQTRDSNVGARKACEDFGHYITKEAKPDKIWANSPSFDLEMLRYMFRKMLVPFPIHYKEEMDFRTLMELTYPVRESRPARIFSGFNVEHHALGDSIEQSFQATRALHTLGLSKESAPLNEKAQHHMAALVETVEARQQERENAQKATSFIKTLPKAVAKRSPRL